MQTFDFYQDVKVTIWARQKFSIEAESYEEALKQVEKYKTEDASANANGGPDCDIEWLYDTWEPLTPEENGGEPTIELYDNNCDILFPDSKKLRYKLLGTNAPGSDTAKALSNQL